MELDGLEGRDARGALRRGEVVDRAVVRVEGGRGRGVVVAEGGLDRLAQPRVRVRDLRGDPGIDARREGERLDGQPRLVSGPPARDAANTDDPTSSPTAIAAANDVETRRTPQPLNGMRIGRCVAAAEAAGSPGGSAWRCWRQAASMMAPRARRTWAGLGSSRTRA